MSVRLYGGIAISISAICSNQPQILVFLAPDSTKILVGAPVLTKVADFRPEGNVGQRSLIAAGGGRFGGRFGIKTGTNFAIIYGEKPTLTELPDG